MILIVKFINPLTDSLQISNVTNVQSTKNVDESGNECSGYVLMFTLEDPVSSTLLVHVSNFSKCVEYMDELYTNGKLDFSADSNVDVHIYSELLEASLSDLLDSLDEEDEDSLDIEGIY